MNTCKYFRCHNLSVGQFDCSLCYCPFYEICGEEKKFPLFGGYILKQNGLLACENCTYFHRKEIVNEYLVLKDKNMSTAEIFHYFTDRLEQEKKE